MCDFKPDRKLMQNFLSSYCEFVLDFLGLSKLSLDSLC